MRWMMWAILGAGVLHVFEEYGWPGGFLRQMRSVAPRMTQSATVQFAVIINGSMLGLMVAAAIIGQSAPVFVLAMAGLVLLNACAHLGAAARARRYVPGLATGVLLYVPLGVTAYVILPRAWDVPALAVTVSLLLALALQLIPPGYLAVMDWVGRSRRLAPVVSRGSGGDP